MHGTGWVLELLGRSIPASASQHALPPAAHRLRGWVQKPLPTCADAGRVLNPPRPQPAAGLFSTQSSSSALRALRCCWPRPSHMALMMYALGCSAPACTACGLVWNQGPGPEAPDKLCNQHHAHAEDGWDQQAAPAAVETKPLKGAQHTSSELSAEEPAAKHRKPKRQPLRDKVNEQHMVTTALHRA